MNKDFQHLKMLSIFHYLLGVFIIAISSLFLFHFAMGVTVIVSPASLGGAPPPPLMGWLFALVGGAAVLLGWTVGIATLLAGRFLSRRKHYIFCMVIATLLAAFFQPFGTVLGVFTIIVLIRPSVKQLFKTGERPYDPEDDEESLRGTDDRITFGSYNITNER